MSEKLQSVTVELEFPVTHEGRDIKELTFRRMKARDALAGEGIESEVRAGYAIFATLAGVDVAVIEELDLEDLGKIGKQIAPLMGKPDAGVTENVKPSPGVN